MTSSLLQFPHTVPAAPISIGIKRQKPSVPTLEAFKKDAENRRHELLEERRETISRIDRLIRSEQNLIDQYEEEIRDHLDGDFDPEAA